VTATIAVATVDAFFARGRTLAKALDAGQPVAGGVRITFERPEDLALLLTSRRLELLRAVRDRPGTIRELSARLTRSRGSLAKDVRLLASAGLVAVAKVANPGHGRMGIIEPVSRGEVLLEARV
jgi:predicted transcriptional regulator